MAATEPREITPPRFVPGDTRGVHARTGDQQWRDVVDFKINETYPLSLNSDDPDLTATAIKKPEITTPEDGGTANSKVVEGTGEWRSTVQVFSGLTVVGTAVVDKAGSWQATVDVSDGSVTLTAKQTDEAGNVSDASDEVSFTLDATPATFAITTSGLSFLDAEPVVIAGTSSEDGTVDVYVDGFVGEPVDDPSVAIGTKIGTTAASNEAWSWTVSSSIPSWTYMLKFVFTDGAGNVSEPLVEEVGIFPGGEF